MEKRTILIPLDGSDYSRRVIAAVSALFPPETNALVLLRVGDEPASINPLPPRVQSLEMPNIAAYESQRDVERAAHPAYMNQMLESERDALAVELIEDEHQLHEAGYEVRTVVEFGDPAQTIAQFVQDDHIDAIAMATHGRTGLRHLLLGSVAERVLHRVSVPVLMIRPFE